MTDLHAGFLRAGFRHYPDAMHATDMFRTKLQERVRKVVAAVFGKSCGFKNTRSESDGWWIGGEVLLDAVAKDVQIEVGFWWLGSAGDPAPVAYMAVPEISGWDDAARKATAAQGPGAVTVYLKGNALQASIDAQAGNWEDALRAVLGAWRSARDLVPGRETPPASRPTPP